MKTTKYFDSIKKRQDRANIKEMDGRYLRVVLLEDEETIHNAFFDRRFKL